MDVLNNINNLLNYSSYNENKLDNTKQDYKNQFDLPCVPRQPLPHIGIGKTGCGIDNLTVLQHRKDNFSDRMNFLNGNDNFQHKTETRVNFNDIIRNSEKKSYVHQNDRMAVNMDRFERSHEKRSVIPFEQHRDTPGLNLKFSEQMPMGCDNNVRILPKTANELRVAHKPKMSYSQPMLMGKRTTHMPINPVVVKRRPYQFKITKPCDMVKNYSESKAPAIEGNQTKPNNTNRSQRTMVSHAYNNSKHRNTNQIHKTPSRNEVTNTYISNVTDQSKHNNIRQYHEAPSKSGVANTYISNVTDQIKHRNTNQIHKTPSRNGVANTYISNVTDQSKHNNIMQYHEAPSKSACDNIRADSINAGESKTMSYINTEQPRDYNYHSMQMHNNNITLNGQQHCMNKTQYQIPYNISDMSTINTNEHFINTVPTHMAYTETPPEYLIKNIHTNNTYIPVDINKSKQQIHPTHDINKIRMHQLTYDQQQHNIINPMRENTQIRSGYTIDNNIKSMHNINQNMHIIQPIMENTQIRSGYTIDNNIKSMHNINQNMHIIQPIMENTQIRNGYNIDNNIKSMCNISRNMHIIQPINSKRSDNNNVLINEPIHNQYVSNKTSSMPYGGNLTYIDDKEYNFGSLNIINDNNYILPIHGNSNHSINTDNITIANTHRQGYSINTHSQQIHTPNQRGGYESKNIQINTTKKDLASEGNHIYPANVGNGNTSRLDVTNICINPDKEMLAVSGRNPTKCNAEQIHTYGHTHNKLKEYNNSTRENMENLNQQCMGSRIIPSSTIIKNNDYANEKINEFVKIRN